MQPATSPGERPKTMKNLTLLGACALALVACNSEPATANPNPQTPPAEGGAPLANSVAQGFVLDNTP